MIDSINNKELKEEVKKFWNAEPCGTKDIAEIEGSREYFEKIEAERYELEPFIHQCAQFTRWRNKKVLEVGVGAGTDFLQFARAGADLYGVDLTPKAIELVKKRLEIYGLKANLQCSDSENLPFEDNTFDLVYSWGVIHHTPETEKAIKEIHRVLKPGGQIIIMIYHRFSLGHLRMYIRYGLMQGKIFVNMKELVSENLESKGTKSYYIKEARSMFNAFSDVNIKCFVTPYDTVRIPRFLSWLKSFIPDFLGAFMVITGKK